MLLNKICSFLGLGFIAFEVDQYMVPLLGKFNT